MALQTPLNYTSLFNWAMRHHVAEIAWRKAPPPQPAKENTVSSPTVQTMSANHINKSKLTGGPAYRELKSIILDILMNNTQTKPQ